MVEQGPAHTAPKRHGIPTHSLLTDWLLALVTEHQILRQA